MNYIDYDEIDESNGRLSGDFTNTGDFVRAIEAYKENDSDRWFMTGCHEVICLDCARDMQKELIYDIVHSLNPVIREVDVNDLYYNLCLYCSKKTTN